MPAFEVPSGYEAILATYGNPSAYRSPRAQMIWQVKYVMPVALPFEVSYIGAPTTEIHVHRKAARNFLDAFRDLQDAGLEALVREFNGTFAFRARAGNPDEFSIRTFGAGIDINASAGAQDPRVVEIFKARSFQWGGEFAGVKEPSLFALCSHYEG